MKWMQRVAISCWLEALVWAWQNTDECTQTERKKEKERERERERIQANAAVFFW